MSLSLTEITAQIDEVLDKQSAVVALAIRAPKREPWQRTLRHRDKEYALRWCASSLAIREALWEAEARTEPDTGLVVLTPLATSEVGQDIVARLAGTRVFQPHGWDTVRQLFKARDIDARLNRFAWMPQALIDATAQGPYAPAGAGFLSLDMAWQHLLQRFLALGDARPDAESLLHWSHSQSAISGLDTLPAAARADAMVWLAEGAGIAGGMIMGCVQAGRTADALPLGLVCSVIFAPAGEGEAALGQAAIRLERFVNDRHVGVQEGRAWAQAAERTLRRIAPELQGPVLERADTLLAELRIAEFAGLSDSLPAALREQLSVFALALRQHATEPTVEHLMRVEAAANHALTHQLLAVQPGRAERVSMARRLARWLLCPLPAASTLQVAGAWQGDEGAYVDWARFRLQGGDEIEALSTAYAACRAAVIERRDAFAQEFAAGLSAARSKATTPANRILPVESVLDQVVAPIAASSPVLLLVMDGLSISIFRELFTRIERLGWTELIADATGKTLFGVAAFPTITEVSRASLLCGKLVMGVAAQEKKGFKAHPALLEAARSRAAKAPELFHKGDLSEDSNLAPAVRVAIEDPKQTVVAVVYNAVDDHLSGPDQLHQRWALEDLRLLLPLLRLARDAQRVLVVTADHGHLLEDGTRQIGNAESDRWRPGSQTMSADEVALKGPRVVTSDDSQAVVCLWGERTRYGGRKNGYHGGVSPQEVMVPLSVLVPTGKSLTGWSPAPPAEPDWWHSPLMASVVADVAPLASAFTKSDELASPKKRAPRRESVPAQQQHALFDEVPASTNENAVSEPTDWIGALLASPIYHSQRQLAARVALTDTQMRTLLTALTERGGKLSRTALAQRMAQPEMRLTGMLSAARRMLNVDQASVLLVDERSATVEVQLALLQQQFELNSPGARL